MRARNLHVVRLALPQYANCYRPELGALSNKALFLFQTHGTELNWAKQLVDGPRAMAKFRRDHGIPPDVHIKVPRHTRSNRDPESGAYSGNHYLRLRNNKEPYTRLVLENPDKDLFLDEFVWIANAVNQGKLVPEDIIFDLLSKRLEEGYYKGETGFILDGIPRTRIQAEILDEIAGIDLVVNFKCTEESLLKQHTRNGIYSPGQEYLCMGKSGIDLNLPSQDNPISSGADSGGCWKEKLRAYAVQSKPLEDYYRKQRKLLDFQVAPGETWQGLLAALHLQHMNAATSQKLTA
ncbi:hypothetical protein Acr_05g0012070 [Actinidia rufa]|uniref:adenylate kinase n=1 Tax=Actinidia rufa TaxID=165716 RepID=A0A7J0EM73_9ERIC|nr:hypothetical protein Acr_05g0012070 [Actinidia rufa]